MKRAHDLGRGSSGTDVIHLDRAARRRPRPKRKPRIPRGPARRVGSPQPPRAVEHYLVAALRREMRHVTKAIARALEGRLESIAKPDTEEDAEDSKRLDAPPADGDAGRAVREITKAALKAADESGPRLTEAAKTAAKRTVKHSEREFQRLKITLKREPDFDKLVSAATKDVVKRFKGTIESQLERLEDILDDGFSMRHETLAKEIARQLEGVSQSRAEALARTSVLNLNSKITTSRMKAAGVEEFVWTTSQDERVRSSHQELEGKSFSYAAPPIVDGEEALPGEQWNCRCTAFPILPELDSDEETEEEAA